MFSADKFKVWFFISSYFATRFEFKEWIEFDKFWNSFEHSSIRLLIIIFCSIASSDRILAVSIVSVIVVQLFVIASFIWLSSFSSVPNLLILLILSIIVFLTSSKLLIWAVFISGLGWSFMEGVYFSKIYFIWLLNFCLLTEALDLSSWYFSSRLTTPDCFFIAFANFSTEKLGIVDFDAIS